MLLKRFPVWRMGCYIYSVLAYDLSEIGTFERFFGVDQALHSREYSIPAGQSVVYGFKRKSNAMKTVQKCQSLPQAVRKVGKEGFGRPFASKMTHKICITARLSP